MRLIKAVLRESILVHSTSWRFERGAVVLTFLAVVTEIGEMDAMSIERSALARNAEHSAPDDISFGQVREHAVRHLAWLAEDDEVVQAALDVEWLTLLSGYVPEPFRQLD